MINNFPVTYYVSTVSRIIFYIFPKLTFPLLNPKNQIKKDIINNRE
jgi:hypothetical protein